MKVSIELDFHVAKVCSIDGIEDVVVDAFFEDYDGILRAVRERLSDSGGIVSCAIG